jgi:hypothetical protein
LLEHASLLGIAYTSYSWMHFPRQLIETQRT